MLDNLEQLKRFVAVAETGTVHRAAESLGLTQPAVTRSIKLLEEKLSAPLFDRQGRGMHLTPFGHRTLQHARHILGECQLANNDLRSVRDGEVGNLRVAAAPVWMSSILPPAIAHLHKHFPEISVTLTALNYNEALPLLRNGTLDMFCGGFQQFENLPSFLVRKATFKTQLSIVARLAHPIQQSQVVEPSTLLAYPWISYQSDLAYLDTLMDPIEKKIGKRVTAKVFCNSMLTVLELLRQADYLAYLPESFCRSNFGSGLTVIEIPGVNTTFESGLIYRRGMSTGTAFNCLYDFTFKRLAELGL